MSFKWGYGSNNGEFIGYIKNLNILNLIYDENGTVKWWHLTRIFNNRCLSSLLSFPTKTACTAILSVSLHLLLKYIYYTILNFKIDYNWVIVALAVILGVDYPI